MILKHLIAATALGGSMLAMPAMATPQPGTTGYFGARSNSSIGVVNTTEAYIKGHGVIRSGFEAVGSVTGGSHVGGGGDNCSACFKAGGNSGSGYEGVFRKQQGVQQDGPGAIGINSFQGVNGSASSDMFWGF
jgi:hypothetical protein